MPTKVRRIDFSPDEWIAGTLGMSLEEEGLYIKICALIWSTGERITIEHLRRCTASHGNAVNAILWRLEVAGKITRNGSEIGQKRAENELENAQKRLGKWRENRAQYRRSKGLAEPSGRGPATRAEPSTSKEEGFSPKELNPSFLTARESAPPLPSRGDGAAASRAATTKEPSSDDLISPAEKAAALAELHRALAAKAKSFNGSPEAANEH